MMMIQDTAHVEEVKSYLCCGEAHNLCIMSSVGEKAPQG